MEQGKPGIKLHGNFGDKARFALFSRKHFILYTEPIFCFSRIQLNLLIVSIVIRLCYYVVVVASAAQCYAADLIHRLSKNQFDLNNIFYESDEP